MTKEQYKSKIINAIVFRIKLANKDFIENLNNTSLEDLLLYYITLLPQPTTISQCHSQFTFIRKYSWPLMKKKGQVSKELNELKEEYRKFIKLSGVSNTADFTPEQFKIYESCLESIAQQETLLKALEDMILKYNDRLEYICSFYDKVDLPLNDLCQLFNINPITAKLNIREEDEAKDKKHYRYLFGGIEQDRSEEGWKSNKSNNMPLFHLIHKGVMIFMDRNKVMKEKMDDFLLHNLGLAQHMVVIKEDSEGNKTLEEYYPKLKSIK